MSAAPKFAPDPKRRGLIAKVHVARKELRLDEETYRDVLNRVTGKSSASDCSEAQLVAVLDDFKGKGWKPAAPQGRAADHPVARKARALWISLNQLGAVGNGSDRALEAFAKRQLRVERLQWADQSQGYKLIEALKEMASRAGWDASGDDVRAMKVRLVQRQWVRLGELGAIAGGGPPAYDGLSMWALRRGIAPCKKGLSSFTDAELEAAAEALGRWVNVCIAQQAG